MAPKPRGTATDEMIDYQQNRVKQEAEKVPDFTRYISGKMTAFGAGYASFGERYDKDKNHGRYCPDPIHCRAKAVVKAKEKKSGLKLWNGVWVETRLLDEKA